MKNKEIDKDTVVAYHEFIQGRIRTSLNSIDLGPGRIYAFVGFCVFIFGLACGVVGILLITLRTRHVYLWSWNDQFLGPAFIIAFICCTCFFFFTMFLSHKKANKYRSQLVFRPIGDYGVAVVHKSRLNYEQATKETLKSGTAPHAPTKPKPYQPISYDYRRPRQPYENRGYSQDPRGAPPSYKEKGHVPGDNRRPPEDRRRPPDDRRRPPDDRDRRRPPDNRDRRRPPDDRDRRRPPDDRERRRPPDDRDRRRPPGDRPRRPPETEEERQKYEEERRRRHEQRRREEERRREMREAGDAMEKPPLPTAFKIDGTRAGGGRNVPDVALARPEDDESEL
ncbi:hypothetical protein KUTeg_003674 [Tegillarca granosa]|uniref:Uncharacterized protein n=1 Tax=Tegillarca granosa TaxID=220873 RepID=A0ABQ9FSB5_TEGGR|nr:hypothetical protein KUTeg_003674 [Tegillarca granosa]